jgi:hypothetical protein
MALSDQQQSDLEFQTAQQTITGLNDAKRNRLELTRLAKEILAENDRNKTIDSRGFTADDVIAEATKLIAFVNA